MALKSRALKGWALKGWALKGWALKGWAKSRALSIWALIRGASWPVLTVVTALAASLPGAGAQGGNQLPGVAAADDAQRAYAAGQYEQARRLWEPQAEAGDPQAQLGLAMLYDLGQGVTRDAASAYRWYLRAAEAGSADGEFNVAVMCDAGDGVPRDTAAAALWYARAAAHGNRRAQYNLGLLYTAGDGVPRNPDQAEVYFRAAAAGLPAAAGKLAAMQRDGRARLPAGAEEAATLTPAQPVAPVDGSTVPALGPASGETSRGGTSGDTVELVWIAPAQAAAVRFFVQLMALDAAGVSAGPHEVFATYLDETAAVVPLERVPGRYAWRVYSIGRDLKHYAASGWERFQVGPQGSGVVER